MLYSLITLVSTQKISTGHGWYAINMEKRFGEDKKKLMWTKIKLVNLEKKNDILLNLFDDELI